MRSFTHKLIFIILNLGIALLFDKTAFNLIPSGHPRWQQLFWNVCVHIPWKVRGVWWLKCGRCSWPPPLQRRHCRIWGDPSRFPASGNARGLRRRNRWNRSRLRRPRGRLTSDETLQGQNSKGRDTQRPRQKRERGLCLVYIYIFSNFSCLEINCRKKQKKTNMLCQGFY